ncbi:tubulin-like doman-containing protein [Alloiococcus sp. CFN-8]|uniref:tubulin-like doman-containing protein n=1 Tax=Alloiococcus sp. CFN-8 TaxID=3416081 RepID=UPI003CF3F04E
MEYKNVPTLLIGLGGIGSTIVNDVYGKLKADGRDKNVQAIVFDTDINSQKMMTNIDPAYRIQTSTDRTVNYALQMDPEAKSWFPYHRLIGTMHMLDGAGQIRAISRLALRSAMDQGALKPIEEARNKIFKLGNDTDTKGLRVMIVTSMMGGTGSGMFLQIPLYIREVIQSQFAMERVEIQGTFILPDVMMGVVTNKEISNIYANAYASMKELSAIIMSLAGDGSSIDLEYKPEQMDKQGFRDITVKDLPYDYCYIYDKEDSKGKVLSSFNDYIRMIENNIYLQLFGPISDKVFSHYINEMRSTVSRNGRNTFGGVGTATLTYPYEDIVDYCTNRLVLESLDNQLLKIDNIFLNERAKYKANEDKGIYTAEPELEDIYIRKFEELAENEPFFKRIKGDLYEIDEYGKEKGSNIEAIKKKLKDEIKKFILEDKELNEIKSKCLLPGSFSNTADGSLAPLIKAKENSLVAYRNEIEGKSATKGLSWAGTLLGIHDENNKGILDEFIKKDDQYINSVGIRYFLYKLHYELKKEKEQLIDRNKKQKMNLKTAEESCFEPVKGSSSRVSASKKVDEAIKNKGIIGRKLKKFKEEYENKHLKHLKLLNSYSEDYFSEAFYTSLVENLEKLLREYENMFGRLGELKFDVSKNCDALYKKHEDTTGTNEMFVLGSQRFKNQMWDKIPEVTKTNALSGALSENIYSALFRNFRMKLNSSDSIVSGYDSLFNTYIVPICREKLIEDCRDILDMNIMDALIKEAEYYNPQGSKEDYIREKLSSLPKIANPWAPETTESSDYNIWGFSEDCRAVYDDPQGKSSLERLIEQANAGKLNISIVEDKLLPRNEIVFVVIRYGLMVNDFAKFSSGKKEEYIDKEQGAYFKAYHELIAKIPEDGASFNPKGTAITPHIDKLWHQTLRDINDDEYKKDLLDASKAFIIGLAEEMFKVVLVNETTGERRFFQKLDGTPKNIALNGANIDDKVKNLYEALSSNRSMVKQIVSKFEASCQDLKSKINGDKDIFEVQDVKNLLNLKVSSYDMGDTILDVFINLYKETPKSEDGSMDDKFLYLYDALHNIIEAFARICSFGQGETVEKMKIKELYTRLINESAWTEKINKESIEYHNTIGLIEGRMKNL